MLIPRLNLNVSWHVSSLDIQYETKEFNMRHLYILLTVFIFLFTVQGQAAKKTKKTHETKNKIVSTKKSSSSTNKSKRASVNLSESDKDMTIKITSAPARINTGSSSCPFKKDGKFTDKSGAYTLKDKAIAKVNATNTRSATGTY